jgi:hypothetical protein
MTPVIRLESKVTHASGVQPGVAYISAYEPGPNATRRETGKLCDKYLIRDFDGFEKFGTYREIAACMEGALEWRQFPMGARLPNEASRRNTDEFAPDLFRLSERDDANLPPRAMAGLWKREADVGANMLKAEVVDGLDHDKILSEVPPPGWRWKAYTNRRGERELERVS